MTDGMLLPRKCASVASIRLKITWKRFQAEVNICLLLLTVKQIEWCDRVLRAPDKLFE